MLPYIVAECVTVIVCFVNILYVLQKKAKKLKKGLMTRAAHKVKKTFKTKQV